MRAVVKYIILLRPHQWLKNLLIFFPPFFGGRLFDQEVMAVFVPALLAFSFAASSGYIFNDVMDKEFDKNHDTKKMRPVAQGHISIVMAIIMAVLLCMAAVLIASNVSREFEAYVIIYIFISLLYTLFFKHLVIIDIFFISFGFLIRVLAGGAAFSVPVSGWLFLTVFIVSLFLASGKRFGEMRMHGENPGKYRKSLENYSISYLEGILWFTASAALVTYALYTIERMNQLFYTVPLVTFGLVRYVFLADKGKGDPTEVLLRDPQMIGVSFFWVIMIGIILYR